MAEKKGAAFERLVAAVQTKLDPGSTVAWDVKLPDPVEGRQIDVAVSGQLEGVDVLVAIETKHFTKKVGIEFVDAFDSVRREVGAAKGIMVTSVGFTSDALIKAQKVGIDTCLLRPANDADWEGYLRTLQLTIQPKKLIYEDAEYGTEDGQVHPVRASGLAILADAAGDNVYFDRVINTALHQLGDAWDPQKAIEVTPIEPLFQDMDPSQPPLRVTCLRCRPRYVDGLTFTTVNQAPEDWVFFKVVLDGTIREKAFFEFSELKAMADEIKVRRTAERKAVRKERAEARRKAKALAKKPP